MEMAPAEAKAVATSAYIYLAPLVANYATMYHEAIDPSLPSDGGGFGHWLHDRTSTMTESDPARAQVTALHSSAWLDLRSEPWVLSIPTMDARLAYGVRTTDLWGFVIDEASEADHHGRVLLASPAFRGEVPAGADRVVRGESDFVRSEMWIQMHDLGDLSQVRSIQQEFVLTPLSALVGVVPPVPAPPVEWWPVHREVGTTDEFWSVASFALTLTVPHQQDRELLERIAEIGVVAGARWDPAACAPHVAEAIGDGLDTAITELMRASSAADPGALRRSREDTDRDFFGRALGALALGPHPSRSAG